MKLIAKAPKGMEFFHSRKEAYFAPDTSARVICERLNDAKFRLKDGTEVWHVYDYDFMQNDYVTGKLYLYKGNVKLKTGLYY